MPKYRVRASRKTWMRKVMPLMDAHGGYLEQLLRQAEGAVGATGGLKEADQHLVEHKGDYEGAAKILKKAAAKAHFKLNLQGKQVRRRRSTTARRRKRKIHTGPRGGRYYVTKGRKVYV